jgi:endonuclease-8
MPEGHSVHRFANRFAKDFVGQVVNVSSPQGRFSTDAALVSQRLLKRSYAIGKQMFLEFDGGGVLRIHLGIYGKWQFHASSNPPVTGQVRARFSIADLTADLRGPTVCELISRKEARAVAARLGPDPLNPNLNGRESKKFIDRVLG